MNKILITGNLGYVGAELMKQLRSLYPNATLIGYDLGYFSAQLTTQSIAPEVYLDRQYYGDVRTFPEILLEGVDTVIQLAAISNDPIGNQFEEVTLDINYRSVIEIAKMAKRQGVKRMVFASSCSVYGFAEETARTEESETNPLTAYAKSKVYAERDLRELADNNFLITCLRFATACGISDRLRLDLVLNDFVAGSRTSKEINILSDGTPWRPLINVRDMSRAIVFGHERSRDVGGAYLVVNAGSDRWNYQIKDLALEIKTILPEINVSINQDAQPDKRSYRVNFAKFESLAKDYQPIRDLNTTILELIEGLDEMKFADRDYRKSSLIRLHVVNNLIATRKIDNKLFLNPQVLVY